MLFSQAISKARTYFLEMSSTLEIEHSGHCSKISKKVNPVGSPATQVRMQCSCMKEANCRTMEDWGFEALALGSYFGISFHHPCSTVIQQT